jgi:hypothetical protein
MGNDRSTATPSVVGDITATWLADVFAAPIDSIDVCPIAAGAGFMGQLARVAVSSPEPSVPTSVIVKMPTSDPGARMIGEAVRVWEREHRLYAELAPSLTIRVPAVFANIAEPPCLVLEDLAPATPGDHLVGATLDQAERSIDVLAVHHARWFEDPLLRTLEWMPGLDDPSVLTIGAMFDVGWPMFLDRYGGRLPERCLRWCEQFVPTIPHWITTHYDDPITLVHGDFRLDNLFFADDGSVAVIDWQLAMRAPGQTDLVYFCANNLTVPMRRAHEDALIDRYVAGLHAAGVPHDGVTRDGVHRGYVEGMLFYASSFGASLLTIDPANERGAALFDQLVHRTFAAVDDLAVGEALGFSS